MTRQWTKEEDNEILNIILSKQPINYEEVIKAHNEKFNKDRTEETYKVRIRKVAKDNNIELVNKNIWTDKDKKYLVNEIRMNPYNSKWEDLSKVLQRSEQSLKNMYNELISAEDHIEACIHDIEKDDVCNILTNIYHECDNCSNIFFSSPFVWNDMEYCEACYIKLYEEIIKERWDNVYKYSINSNKNKCNICKIEATFDNKLGHRFHYDHINMFNKDNSVCNMVKTGINIEDIYKEIDKCQLLCVSCHTAVTKIEHVCGFIRLKQSMTREYNNTNDIEKRNELINKYSTIYTNFIDKIYKIIQEIL
jgi:hypothetical protein